MSAMMNHLGKWSEFIQVDTPPSLKTKVWDVRSKNGVTIGRITWSTGWRKYILRSGLTDWEEDCLSDVMAFIKARTLDHKSGKE